MTFLTNKEIPLGSTAWTMNGIRRMWKELNVIVAEQAEIELSRLVKPIEQSIEDFDAYKQHARTNIFKILGTLEFENDDVIQGVDPEILEVEADGPRIRLIHLSNVVPYQRLVGSRPDFAFTVVIDLRNPKLFELAGITSDPTPNSTSLSISGGRSGWQGGIEAVVRRNINRRRPIRTWFHGAMIYDLFLFSLAIPLALYACWTLEPLITKWLSPTSSVVVGATYLYVGFCVLWIYRFMFSYAKWAFPFAEITDQENSPAKHRAVWWSLVAAILFKPVTSAAGELWKSAIGMMF